MLEFQLNFSRLTKGLILIFILIGISPLSQSEHQVKRIVKREIRKHRFGEQYDNGPGSGMQTSFNSTHENLILKLKALPNVEDATWDKCANKIDIYPGWSVIGVKFKGDSLESCFHIQHGSLGTIWLFGFRPPIFKPKFKLIYKKMYHEVGFVKKQHQICEEE